MHDTETGIEPDHISKCDGKMSGHNTWRKTCRSKNRFCEVWGWHIETLLTSQRRKIFNGIFEIIKEFHNKENISQISGLFNFKINRITSSKNQILERFPTKLFINYLYQSKIKKIVVHFNNLNVSIHQLHKAPDEKVCVFRTLFELTSV